MIILIWPAAFLLIYSGICYFPNRYFILKKEWSIWSFALISSLPFIIIELFLLILPKLNILHISSGEFGGMFALMYLASLFLIPCLALLNLLIQGLIGYFIKRSSLI